MCHQNTPAICPGPSVKFQTKLLLIPALRGRKNSLCEKTKKEKKEKHLWTRWSALQASQVVGIWFQMVEHCDVCS